MKKKLVIEIDVPFSELPGTISYRLFLDHSVVTDEDDTKTEELLRENHYKPSGSYSNDGKRKLLWTRDFPYFGDRIVQKLENKKEKKMSKPFNCNVATISFFTCLVLMFFINHYTGKGPLEIALWMLIPLIILWSILKLYGLYLTWVIQSLEKKIKILQEKHDDLRTRRRM